ncbi:MAG TPA: hypothetical protein PK987_05985 [Ferruginibacter sp.]|nr:hypothetical protein [Ferruginibacter sp.]
MDKTLIENLQHQNYTTLCCIDETVKPICFSCFYVVDILKGLLYFKSSADSLHTGLMKKNPFITVFYSVNKLAVKSIQFEAVVVDSTVSGVGKKFKTILKKTPVVSLIPGEL